MVGGNNTPQIVHHALHLFPTRKQINTETQNFRKLHVLAEAAVGLGRVSPIISVTWEAKAPGSLGCSVSKSRLRKDWG